MKPRLSIIQWGDTPLWQRNSFKWRCLGDEVMTWGATPAEAYSRWQKVVGA